MGFFNWNDLKHLTIGTCSYCLLQLVVTSPMYFILKPQLNQNAASLFTASSYECNMFQNTINSNINFSSFCQICALNKYAHQIGHICLIFEIYMEEVYTYMCHIWSHCHEPCHNGYCTHIWHISWNKSGCQHCTFIVYCTATIVHLQTPH